MPFSFGTTMQAFPPKPRPNTRPENSEGWKQRSAANSPWRLSTPVGTITVGRGARALACWVGGTVEQYSMGLLGLGLRHATPAGLTQSAAHSKQNKPHGQSQPASRSSHQKGESISVRDNTRLEWCYGLASCLQVPCTGLSLLHR